MEIKISVNIIKQLEQLSPKILQFIESSYNMTEIEQLEKDLIETYSSINIINNEIVIHIAQIFTAIGVKKALLQQAAIKI
jgi:hypothetical protein